MPTLDQLKPGARAKVLRLTATGAIGQRLSEMGLIEGAMVKVIRTAPLGDPLEIEFEDWLLSLRKAEARTIEVVQE